MKAMILAAGLGKRLSPYTDILAKPAIPFLNIPLFYYSIALLKAAPKFLLSECVINSHYKPEQIRELAKALSPNIKTHVTLEKEEPLGSGGGVWFAREFFKDEKDFVVTNGDEVILPTHLNLMDQMLEQHQSSGALATLLVKRDPRVGTQFGGVWANPLREVFGFGKRNPSQVSSPPCLESSLEAFHYVGVMIMNSRALQYFPEGESNILYDAIMRGHLKGEKIEIYIDDCRWYETGNIKDFLSATREVLTELQKNPKDFFLTELLKNFAPHSALQKTQIGSDPKVQIFADQSAKIHAGAKISGFAVLGSGVEVPAGCHLQNVVVNKNVKLKAETYQDTLCL